MLKSITDFQRCETLIPSRCHLGTFFCTFRLKTVAILVNVSEPVAAGEAQVGGTNGSLALLEKLGKAVAEGAEADEDIIEISTGTVDLKVTCGD